MRFAWDNISRCEKNLLVQLLLPGATHAYHPEIWTALVGRPAR